MYVCMYQRGEDGRAGVENGNLIRFNLLWSPFKSSSLLNLTLGELIGLFIFTGLPYLVLTLKLIQLRLGNTH